MERATLRRVAAFHAIVVGGSISAAASRIGKSGPAVHHDLKCLEEALGRPLFDRVGRSLRLTPAGRHLHESLSRNLDEMGRALERFAKSPDLGVLRLAVVSGFGRYRLAPPLFARTGLPPIEMFMGSHDQVLEALLRGQADAAITYKPVTALPFVVEPLASEDYVLVGPEGMRLDASFAAIEALRFVTYDEYEYVFARWFQTMFGRQPRRLGRSDHTTELEEALESVASGRGVTITLADAWRSGPWRTRCRDLLDGGGMVSNQLYLLTIAGAAPSASAIVADIFRAEVREPM